MMEPWEDYYRVVEWGFLVGCLGDDIAVTYEADDPPSNTRITCIRFPRVLSNRSSPMHNRATIAARDKVASIMTRRPPR